jgi:hypothetical protein
MNRSTEPKGRGGSSPAAAGAVRRGVLQSNLSGSIRVDWMVDICQLRPMASRAWTEIFGA